MDITHALQSLAPKAQWTLTEGKYSGLTWLSDDIEQPTEEALIVEAARLQAEYEALEYQRLRAPEYPSITDYIDGVVKGDQAQIDKYIADCLAVKAKYPKPE